MLHLRRHGSRRNENAGSNKSTTWCGRIVPWVNTTRKEVHEKGVCIACLSKKRIHYKPIPKNNPPYNRSRELYLSKGMCS